MKRIKITRRGVFRNGTDMIPVGTELDVPSDFTGWNGKWLEVSSTEGKRMEPASPNITGTKFSVSADVPEDQTPEGFEALDYKEVGASGVIDETELRDEYERVIGKRPGPRMKADTMRKHIDEAASDE